MSRPVSLLSAAALVCFLAGSIVLARLDRGGPPHADVWLEGGVPATLFLPGDGGGRDGIFDLPPEGQRPPALVLMHGFAGDRVSMSSLARRIASGGIAVLTIDAAGHGENRNPYRRSPVQGGFFASDLASAVDFLRMHPGIDGSRIAVGGHSMGAGAALDYATRDSAVAATVMISGAGRLEGPFAPANALFVYAAADPARIRERSDLLAARLAGVTHVEHGRTYGQPERGNAVRVVEVRGPDHLGIVWNDEAVREVQAWLDEALALEGAPAEPAADRRPLLLLPLGLAFLAVLPGLGGLAARLAPAWAPRAGEGRWADLTWVGAAFVLTMPLLVSAPQLAPVPLAAADALASQLGLAGLALLAAIGLRRPALLEGVFQRAWATLWAAALTLVAVTALLHPFGTVLHRVSLTPERTLAWLGLALALLPLALSLNLLLRRGAPGGATLAVLAGRLLVLLLLILGIGVGVLPTVMLFLLPALVLLALVFEVLAYFLYAGSRNVLAVALVDAGWLALVLAAVMPIRL